MPVQFDSSTASAIVSFAGTATTGSTSGTHRASTVAANLYATVTLYWTGTVNPTTAAFAATFGGVAADPVPDGQVIWTDGTQYAAMTMFYLPGVVGGQQAVTASFSGIAPTGGEQRFGFISETNSGVAAIGSAVIASGNSSGLAIPSDVGQMAFAAYTAVETDSGDTFSSFSGTIRSTTPGVSGYYSPLLLGDVAGAPPLITTTVTAPPSRENGGWGGIGLQLIGPDVAYDATGTAVGKLGTLFNVQHDIGAGAGALVVPVGVTTPDTSAAITMAAEVDGQELDLLASLPNYSTTAYGARGDLYLFGTLNPPAGSQTIEITANRSVYASAESVSYMGVSAFGAVSTSGSLLDAVTVASLNPANMVVGMHGITPASPANAFSSYSGTKRAVLSYTSDQLMVAGDAPGAASVQLVATMTSTTGWGAIGVNLLPAIMDVALNATIGPIDSVMKLTDYRSQAPSPSRYWLVES